MNLLFNEIFGDLPKPAAQKAEPTMPWDDPFWELAPVRTAASAVCNKIASAALVDEICGASDVPEVALQGFDALVEFRKLIPTPVPITPRATDDLRKFANRAEIAKRAPVRASAIRKIIESCLGKFRKAATADAFQRLQQSAERCVTEAIILET